MNIAFHVCRIVFDALFPIRSTDILLEAIDARMLSRYAHPPIIRLGTMIVAPLPYGNTLVQKAIHAAKYRGNAQAVMLLGEAIAPFVAEELAERHMVGSFEYPIIIPIPLHKTRERERGFNQSERIASALIRHIPDVPLVLESSVLIRHKRTKSQAKTKSREFRLENMVDAFSVPNPSAISERHIILLDDVVTTGATMKSARDTLLHAGAREVLCVAVAH